MNNGCLSMSCVGAHSRWTALCPEDVEDDGLSAPGQYVQIWTAISYFAFDHEDDCCPMWSKANGLVEWTWQLDG